MKYMILDIDERSVSGQRLRDLAASHGKVLPPTAEVSRSKDGLHYRLYYAVPEDLFINKRSFWDKRVWLSEASEMDIIMGTDLNFKDIQPAPEWLVELVKSARPEAAAPEESSAPILHVSPPSPGDKPVQQDHDCDAVTINVDGVQHSRGEAGGESAVVAVDGVSIAPSPSVDGVDRPEPYVCPVQASAVDGVDEIIVDTVDGVTLRQSRCVDGVWVEIRPCAHWISRKDQPTSSAWIAKYLGISLRKYMLAGQLYPVYEEALRSGRPYKTDSFIYFYARSFADFCGCQSQDEYQRVYKALASAELIECRKSLRIGNTSAKMHRIHSAMVDECRA